MLLLAFDTATPAVTVALHDGTRVLAGSTTLDARRHGELLVPTVSRVLAEAGCAPTDVTDIAVGAGPGPYTGLRVGLMTARALGDALAVPVHGVCTLDALAWAVGHGNRADSGEATPGGPFVVATDARRKEVYWARYSDPATRVAGPSVDRPADIDPADTALPAVGAGAAQYPEVFTAARGPRHPDAGALADLATTALLGGRPLLPPEPLYLRRPDAKVPVGYKTVSRG